MSSELELYDRFLTALCDPESALPRDTILGAVTHYISTLSAIQVGDFVRAICRSERLWDTPQHAARSREAVRLGVEGALSALDAKREEGRRWYAVELLRGRDADEWVRKVLGALQGWDEGYEVLQNGGSEVDVAVALLVGLSRKSGLVSGAVRREVEEEVVVWLSDVMDASGPRGVWLLTEAMGAIEMRLLRILDVPAILARVQWYLLRSLPLSTSAPAPTLTPTPTPTAGSVASSSSIFLPETQALARTLAVLFNSLSTTAREGRAAMAPTLMLNFILDIRSALAQSPDKRTSTALSAYITVTLSILDYLLRHLSTVTNDEIDTANMENLCIEALLTLSMFAPEVEAGSAEGYEALLGGLVDVLVGTSGSTGVRRLFEKRSVVVNVEREDASHDVWWLNVAESVVRDADDWTIKQIRPSMERRLRDPSHRASFESAHSLKLALIHAASDTLSTSPSNEVAGSIESSARKSMQARLMAESEEYCDILIKQLRSGDITPDQIRSAYPLVVSDISRVNPSAGAGLLQRIDELSLSPPSAGQGPGAANATGALRLHIIIKCIPSLPTPLVVPYLEKVKESIDLESTSGEKASGSGLAPHQISELKRTIFDVIMRELPDASRKDGMEWWVRWMDEGEAIAKGMVRARL